MFCDQCGTQLQPAQTNCARCGKPVVGPPSYRRNRVQEHVRLVGVLWMAYSALLVLGGIAVIIVAHTIFGGRFHPPGGPPPPWSSAWKNFLAVSLILSASLFLPLPSPSGVM